MNPNLANISTADLQKEIRDRQERERQVLILKFKTKSMDIIQNIDALLLFAEHNCGSDDNFNNNESCPRCALLRAKKYGYWDWIFELKLEIIEHSELTRDPI